MSQRWCESFVQERGCKWRDQKTEHQRTANPVEPWMRGTHGELDVVRRAVVHALELAEEDVTKWCGELNDAEMMSRPSDVAPIAFHLRHIARSLDRLLTYAENRMLDEAQMRALKTEMDPRRPQRKCCESFAKALRTRRSACVRVAPGELRGVSRCWAQAVADDCWWFADSLRGTHVTACWSGCDDGEVGDDEGGGSMKIDFAGKVSLVAGGTGGLGRAVSLAFLDEGAKVIVPYRNEKEFAELRRAAPGR